VTGLVTIVANIDVDLGTAETNITNLQSDISTLQDDVTDLDVTLNGEIDFLQGQITDNTILHQNLGYIELFEERNDIEDRTKSARLVHNRTSDLVIDSDDLHMIPSYIATGVLPTIKPNDVDSNWVVTSGVSVQLSKNIETPNKQILPVSANTPIILNDPDGYTRLGVLNEVARKFNAIYSDTLNDASWTTNGLGVSTPSLGTVASPIVGENYWEIFETAVTDQHRIRQHTSIAGNANYANWLVLVTPKTGNDRNIRLEFTTGGVARDVFITSSGTWNGTAGGFNQQEDYIRSETIDLGNAWQIGILMRTSSTSNMRCAVNLNVGTSTANYLGVITNKILVQRVQIISIAEAQYNDPMPLAIETLATVIDRPADSIILEDWVTKGYMGSYSGRVITKFGNGDIIEQSWEGDQLTVTTNGVSAAPITSAIPTDYTMLKGVVNSVQIKKISDDAPDLPIGFDFNISRGFGVNVDGGGAATPIVVANLTQWHNLFSSSSSSTGTVYTTTGNKVIDIQANLDLTVNGNYIFGSNTTIKSTTGARIQYGQFRFDTISNILLQNIERRRNLNTGSGKGDLINCKSVEGVLIKHCKFDGEATGIWTQNGQVYDGLVDFGNGASDDITVMFCQFLNHNKGMLLGSELFAGLTKATIAWNYWYNVYQRFPRVANTHLDFTNNYLVSCRNGVGLANNANIRGAKNYYKDCNKAIDLRVGAELGAYYNITDDLFDNVASGTTIRVESVPSWTIPATVGGSPYAVTSVDNVADVPSFVLTNSGNVLHTL
jgi:pectate lyase